MKLKNLLGFICIATAPVVLSDNHASDGVQWSMGAPLEMYGCSFKEGIDGYEQSQKFAASWNKWADDNDAHVD